MQVTKKKLIILGAIVVLAIAGTLASTMLASNPDDPDAPSVSEAPYKVTAFGDTYYPVGYGIKVDGTLRIEVVTTPSGVVELDSNLEPIKQTTKILEIPPGEWKLYDRITGDEIKRTTK